MPIQNILDPAIPFKANTLADYVGQTQTQEQNQNTLAMQRNQLKAYDQQQKQQALLRSILADPSNKDPKTGLVSDEAIGKVTAVDPDLAIKMSSMRSQAMERKAQAAHLDSETADLNAKRTLGVLTAGAAILDDPELPPDQRQEKARNAMIEAIDLESVSQEEKDAAKQRVANLTPEQIRTGITSLKLAQKAIGKKSGDVETLTDGANTFDHDKLTGENIGVSGPDVEPGKPFDPHGKVEKIGSGTTPRSPAAAAVKKYLEEHPEATAEDIAKFNAEFHVTQTAGTAPVKADAQSLANITKIADSAEAYENTAIANFKTALDFAKDPEKAKSLPHLGPFLNRWVEEGETMLGDTTIPAYVAAVLTGANEYAKVMSGSTGSQGSTVDSRKEAREIFSPYLNQGQIGPVIDIAERDMNNKKKFYHEQVEAIKTRIKGDNATGGAVKPPLATGVLPRGLKPVTAADNGTPAYNKAGKLVAIVKNGKWEAP